MYLRPCAPLDLVVCPHYRLGNAQFVEGYLPGLGWNALVGARAWLGDVGMVGTGSRHVPGMVVGGRCTLCLDRITQWRRPKTPGRRRNAGSCVWLFGTVVVGERLRAEVVVGR